MNNLSFNDPDKIQQKMWDYIGGETNAANSVGAMLVDISRLASKVDTEYELVINSIEQARSEVGDWRQTFIDIEKEIRNSMG